jgi:H+-transporting ATPase
MLTIGLNVISSAIYGARVIFQRMRSYTIYAVTMTVRLVVTFFLLTVAWNYLWPIILVVMLAICNDLIIISISKDRVVASAKPDKWHLSEVGTNHINIK